MLTPLTPNEAITMMRNGAVMCDIRSPGEFAQEHISGATNVPLPGIDNVDRSSSRALIFCCFSGARTAMAADRLAQAAGRPAYVLEGGLLAWKGAGLPVANR